MFKNILLSTAAVLFVPVAAAAVTIEGQIDFGGQISLSGSVFTSTGNADFVTNGLVSAASGDFGAAGIGFGDVVTMTDIDFAAPSAIWSVGGFTFTAVGFSNFQNTATKAFTALGTVSGNGYEATSGLLTFSAQENQNAVDVSFSTTTLVPAPVPLPASGLMLIASVAGIAAMRKRRA